MVIHVLKIAGGADTQDQGAIIHARLLAALRDGGVVTVSFDGIDTATSSFVNVGFVRLLDKLTFKEIKDRVRVVRSNRQINEMIRTRLAKQASLVVA